jgi:hypothetical protein
MQFDDQMRVVEGFSVLKAERWAGVWGYDYTPEGKFVPEFTPRHRMEVYYLDPSIGWMPRIAEKYANVTKQDCIAVVRTTVHDATEKGGIWWPMAGQRVEYLVDKDYDNDTLNEVTPGYRLIYQVIRAEIKETFQPSDFALEFPPKAVIFDEDSGRKIVNLPGWEQRLEEIVNQAQQDGE